MNNVLGEDALLIRRFPLMVTMNAHLSEDFDVTSTHKTSASKAVKIPPNTAYVAQHVPFWRDQKFWIQIAIMGIMQLVIVLYMDADLKYYRNSDKENSCADSARDVFKIADKKEFADLLDEDWKTRKETIADDLNKKTIQLTESMEKLKSEVTEELNMVKREWEKREQTLKEDWSKMFEERATQLTENMENLKSEMKGELTSVKKEWQKREPTINEEMSATIEETATQLIENMENVKSEIKGKLTSVKEEWEKRELTLKDDFSRIIEEIKEKLQLFDKKFEGVDGQLNHFYSEIGGISLYIVVFFLAMVIGGIICINKLLTPRQRPLERSPHSLGQGLKPIDTITEALKREGLRNGTLIISFHSSTQHFHLSVLDAVLAFVKSTPLKVVIQCSQDLMNVQPQKLVIIFVDFNDMNIILENEESETGDLRNQTTKVFMSLGCDVFVVYCKDLGSRDLKQNNLYNARLNCINRHPVLSELKNKNRVMSINDKFHPHQMEHLKNCFQQL